jgi:hypothetical protein
MMDKITIGDITLPRNHFRQLDIEQIPTPLGIKSRYTLTTHDGTKLRWPKDKVWADILAMNLELR